MEGVELGVLLRRLEERLERCEAQLVTVLAGPSLEPRVLAMETDLAEAAADLAALASDIREAEEAAIEVAEAAPESEEEEAPPPEPEPESEPEAEVTPVRQMWLHRRLGRGA